MPVLFAEYVPLLTTTVDILLPLPALKEFVSTPVVVEFNSNPDDQSRAISI